MHSKSFGDIREPCPRHEWQFRGWANPGHGYHRERPKGTATDYPPMIRCKRCGRSPAWRLPSVTRWINKHYRNLDKP